MTGDERVREIRELEARFAEAMTHLYAVGNALARLRHDLEQPRPAPAPSATAPPVTAPPVTAPPVTAPPAAQPGTAPMAPPIPPVPTPHAPTPPGPTPPASTSPGPLETPQPSFAPASPPLVAPEPTNALGRWWQRESAITRLLGITGAVVTLVGLVMLLVLAVQQRWFGPVPRVTLGVLLAVALVVLAHWSHHRERADGRPGHGAVALAGTGYAAAYLDVVAVTAIYHWVPPLAGLVLAILVVGSGLFIARRWNSQVLAVLILLGAAVLVPVVAGRATWLLSAFMVVLALASWPAQWGRTWPAVAAARLIPALVVITPTIGMAQSRPEEPWAHALVTTVLAVGGLAISVREARSAAAATSPLTIITTGLPLLVALGHVPSPWRTVIFLIAAVVWLGHAALGESQDWLPRPAVAASSGMGTLALLLAIVARDDHTWTGTILLAVAAAYVLVAGATRSVSALAWGLALSAVALLVYVRHPLSVLFEREAMRADLAVPIADSLIAAGLVVLLAWLARRLTAVPVATRRVVSASAAVFGLVIATTALVSLGVLLGRGVDSPVAGFRAGHALATILWMLVAAWLLIRGLRRADTDLAMWLGLGLAAGAVAKLFVYDLAVLSGIWRVVAFIVVGLLLLGTGAGYARALERARSTTPA